jgi:hypothetical protein
MPAMTTASKSDPVHPSLRHRAGAAAETALLAGAFAAIWGSIAWVLVGALLG